MLLTDPAVQYWSCVAAVLATLAVLMLWNKVRGPRALKVLSRAGLLVGGYFATAVAVLVSVNIAYGGLIVSVSDLFADLNPPMGHFGHHKHGPCEVAVPGVGVPGVGVPSAAAPEPTKSATPEPTRSATPGATRRTAPEAAAYDVPGGTDGHGPLPGGPGSVPCAPGPKPGTGPQAPAASPAAEAEAEAKQVRR